LKSDRLKSISMDRPAKSVEKGKGKRVIKVSIRQSKIQQKSAIERICWIYILHIKTKIKLKLKKIKVPKNYSDSITLYKVSS